MTEQAILSASFHEISKEMLYKLLRLRSAVFVVEQECPYEELDGRDLEPSTTHLWIEEGGVPIATARTLKDPDGTFIIGRVCTDAQARGRGLAAQLMRHAIETSDASAIVIKAQCYLSNWYGTFGFVVDGDEFLEDGIPHVPMRLTR